MKIYIRTSNLKVLDDNKTSHKIIDWNNRSDRKWLESHMHWAMNNLFQVSICPANRYHEAVTEIFAGTQTN